MKPLDFQAEDDAKAYKMFLEQLTGIEPMLTVRETPTDTAIPEIVWRVTLREVNLEHEQELECTKFLRRLIDQRQEYLGKKYVEFYTLNAQELAKRWEAGKSLDTDEMRVLRTLMRRASEIDKSVRNVRLPRTCRQCGMVEGNCTCARSWF